MSFIDYKEAYTTGLTISGVGFFSVSSITLTSGVNSPTTLDVICFPKASPTNVIPITPDIQSMLGVYHARAQNLLLLDQNAKTPNTAVIVMQKTLSGASQELRFDGFLTSSAVTISQGGNVGLRFTASHQAFILSTVNTSIYSKCLPTSEKTVGESDKLKAVKSLGTAAILVIEKWERDLASTLATWLPPLQPSEIDYYKAVHADNAPGLAYAKQILTDNISNLTLPLLSIIKDFDKPIIIGDVIHQILTGNADLLQGILGSSGLVHHFGLVFSCPFSSPGAMVIRPMDCVSGKTGTKIKIGSPHMNYSPRVGGPGFVPLRGVRMALSGVSFGPESYVTVGTTSVPKVAYLTWPRSAATAGVPRVTTISPPAWLKSSLLAVALSTPVAAGTSPDASVPNVSGIKAASKATDSQKKDSAESQISVMEDWLRIHYEYGALDTSTEDMSFALQLAIADPGLMATVTRGNGGTPLFDGFVASVTHSLVVDEDASAARTSISFSHVRTPGFRLP